MAVAVEILPAKLLDKLKLAVTVSKSISLMTISVRLNASPSSVKSSDADRLVAVGASFTAVTLIVKVLADTLVSTPPFTVPPLSWTLKPIVT